MKKLQHPQIIPDKPYISDILQIINKENIKKSLSVFETHEEIKIVYFGTPEFSAYILEKLIEFCQTPQVSMQIHPRGVHSLPKSFTIQAIVTRADKPVGRKQEVKESPVAMVAKKHGIPVLKPAKLDEEFLTSHLPFLTSHLIIVASYGKIIPQSLLDIPKLGAINVHGSILPKYRGASPIQSAILNGDKTTGVTIMLMDAEMDHGDILSTKEISISEKDTHQSLSIKLSQASAPLLMETLVKFIEGKVKPKPQNHKIATYTKLIKKEDSFIDIENPPSSEILDRMIRAYYPWPGVWTRFRQGSSGQAHIVKFYPGGLVQMEGKKVVPFKDFRNGYPDFPTFPKN